MQYNKVNNIFGWLSFAIAFVVYYLTMSPTASFWDCGEFIACANELEVPHPPGAPFFLILGRFFAMFASSELTVAWWVNMVSVVSSAFCVMFTFWITTHLAKKMLTAVKREIGMTETIVVMVAGLLAAMTCTFSESFWFNAVEAEVYALSSFFTAIVVWLIFKWEARADEPDNLKWLILISFLIGISIGTHLLNLLAVPMLAFVYYFRKHKVDVKGIIITFVTSVAILGFIQVGVIQWSVEIAWALERVLVGVERMDTPSAIYEHSGMGMPFGTGIIIFMVLAFGSLLAGIFVTQSESLGKRFFATKSSVRVILNTICWSMLVVVIGYSSYTMIVIRASAGTPINENDPSSIASMISYLKREQYGENPLATGVRYNDAADGANQILLKENESYVTVKEPRVLGEGSYKMEDGQMLNVNAAGITNMNVPAANEDGKFVTSLADGRKIQIDPTTKVVSRVEDRYVWYDYKQDVDYKRGKVLFPRMHSPQGGHYTGAYGYKNYVKRLGPTESPVDDSPTMGEDMKFFLDYQVRHMYLRYFMWNFAGRETDQQDDGWESGFGAISQSHKDLPAEIKDNAGRNHFFALPLLLGILGMVFQFTRNYKDATSIMLLFFFTGLAIVLYLNQTPSQPRERDYSYAGSFQTFAIWVGLSVVAIYEILRELGGMGKKLAMGLSIATLAAPVIMAAQGWDDHSRAIRVEAPDSAFNLLNSCKKNGILFTNGDNDTFPLWYLQEVEGIRTDVRVVNLSLLNTDWYIDQMRHQSNDSPPLPISAKQDSYIGSMNSFRSWPKGRLVELPVDSAKVVANGTVLPEYVPYMFKGKMSWPIATRGGQASYLLKQDWMILDIVMTNALQGWERPIYFSSTIPPSSYIGLQPYFQVEGLANRVVPVDFNRYPCQTSDPYGARNGRIQKDISYDLLMKTFRYRNLSNPDLYLDEHVRRTIVGNMATMIFRAANAFTDDADCLEAQNSGLAQMKAAGAAPADSVDRLIAANMEVIAADKRKAGELLTMAEDSISDKARGYDIIMPMFSATVWEKIGNKEKVASTYKKVLDKAEAWITYRLKHEISLPDYDRILSAVPFVLQRSQLNKDYETAARAADLIYQDSGDPSYKALSEQMRQQAKGGGTPTELPINP